MSRFIRDAVVVAGVLLVLIVIARATDMSARPKPVADSAAASQGAAPAAAPQMQHMQHMRQLESSIRSLGDARNALLRKAATEPDDTEGLAQLGAAYRDSIAEMRGTVTELRLELGPEQASAIMGMMMGHTTAMSQRMLSGELFGTM